MTAQIDREAQLAKLREASIQTGVLVLLSLGSIAIAVGLAWSWRWAGVGFFGSVGPMWGRTVWLSHQTAKRVTADLNDTLADLKAATVAMRAKLEANGMGQK